MSELLLLVLAVVVPFAATALVVWLAAARSGPWTPAQRAMWAGLHTLEQPVRDPDESPRDAVIRGRLRGAGATITVRANEMIVEIEVSPGRVEVRRGPVGDPDGLIAAAAELAGPPQADDRSGDPYRGFVAAPPPPRSPPMPPPAPRRGRTRVAWIVEELSVENAVLVPLLVAFLLGFAAYVGSHYVRGFDGTVVEVAYHEDGDAVRLRTAGERVSLGVDATADPERCRPGTSAHKPPWSDVLECEGGPVPIDASLTTGLVVAGLALLVWVGLAIVWFKKLHGVGPPRRLPEIV